VLLSGLGADELFGGYIRHETAFNRQGYRGLIDELRLDVSRLGKRNLGRDDRAMATWEREVRFPFLDEAFVSWAIQLPISHKCDFANKENTDELCGTPEAGKRILRLLAQELGMSAVAREKKRAVSLAPPSDLHNRDSRNIPLFPLRSSCHRQHTKKTSNEQK
jgi:asparagine synthetase B (glutamine-hydrolysing)